MRSTDILRCRALERRGLSRQVTNDLWRVGDVSLVAEFEALTDEQLRKYSRLAANTAAAMRGLTDV